MSKLVKLYTKLKQENPNKLYLFKSGIFYIAIDDDALTLSELFDFKIIDLNSKSIKCGFPTNKISYYSGLLNINNIDFEIINSLETVAVQNTNQVLYENIINEILKINFDEISFKDAFFKLQNLQEKLKNTSI